MIPADRPGAGGGGGGGGGGGALGTTSGGSAMGTVGSGARGSTTVGSSQVNVMFSSLSFGREKARRMASVNWA